MNFLFSIGSNSFHSWQCSTLTWIDTYEVSTATDLVYWQFASLYHQRDGDRSVFKAGMVVPHSSALERGTLRTAFPGSNNRGDVTCHFL